MRLCADACTPANLPGWADEASYVDGTCGSLADTKIRISSLGTNAGNALDVEPGNPVYGSAVVNWVKQRRAAGEPWVWVYCFEVGTNGVENGSGYTWTDLLEAFDAAGEPDPLWWVAIPAASRQGTSTPLPAGSYMCQVLYDVAPGYDVSVMAEYVPGYDPAPVPTPDPAITSEEDMVTTVYGGGQLFTSWVDPTSGIVYLATTPWQTGDTVTSEGKWEIGYNCAVQAPQINVAPDGKGVAVTVLNKSGQACLITSGEMPWPTESGSTPAWTTKFL